MQPVSSSLAYMTNHTNHFKQLELALVINHRDACRPASNRAAPCLGAFVQRPEDELVDTLGIKNVAVLHSPKLLL